jgi:PRTRC genetic system protein C
MTATAQTLTRRFRFGSTILEDVDPTLEPAEVIKLYIPSYPFLAHATLGEATVEGDTLVFPVVKQAVQTKGARCDAAVEDALAALDGWAARAATPAPTVARSWAGVSQLVDDVLDRPATPITDAFMVPML